MALLSPQGAVLSQLLRASAHLDGVLLEAVTVLGVTSPPRQVLANGALVDDFSYRSDTQASAASRRPWALSLVLPVLTLPSPPGAESPSVAAHVRAVCDQLVLSPCWMYQAAPSRSGAKSIPYNAALGLWLPS